MSSGFKFGSGSKEKLSRVHPDLRLVASLALELSPYDFTIVEGIRSKERQAQLVAAGASRTMNSRHRTGDAYDFCPWIDGKLAWNNREAFLAIVEAHFQAADELGILIQSGSDWDMDGVPVDKDPDESFFDAPHIQRPWPYRERDAQAAQDRRQALARMATSGTIEDRITNLEGRVSALESKDQ